jgi:hypothetical protein
MQQRTPPPPSEWQTGPQAWDEFVRRHPELGLSPGRWSFHNFLRLHRAPLVTADAIRLAQGRHWVAHVERFCAVAFDCSTGRVHLHGAQPLAVA